jgi:signal transduction histidine kinase/HAMP domain-containing protein
MFPLRLHAKFLVLVLGSLVFFLGVLSYALVRRETAMLSAKAEEKQHALAFAVYSDLKDSMIEGNPRGTLKLIENLRGTYGLVRLEILRQDGAPAFGFQKSRLYPPQLGLVFKTGEKISFFENDAPPLHTVLYPLKNEKECRSCHKREQPILGALLVSLSMEDAFREIDRSTRELIVFLVTVIFMTGGIVYFAVRKAVLQPLAVLHKGAERIGRGELDHRITLATNDEIQDLARSFNVMAGSVQESYAGLELRIRERTAEVRDRAVRLYEYSRSVATISRLSTKAFNADQTLDEMLDRFGWSIGRGLRYPEWMLCLVDRKRARLEVKRDGGLGAVLHIEDQSLSGEEPIAALARSSKEVFVDDISRDPVFSRYQAPGGSLSRGLYVVPILAGTHEKLCWQEKNCIKTDCPGYKREGERCWLLQGTLCGNALIDSYGDKLSYCMNCGVFPVLGMLIVAIPPGALYRRRDVSVLRILAAEMGAALENHRLHQDNRRLVRELLELHNVTASALADFSLDRALEVFTDSALKFSGLDACSFWLLSEDGRELVLKSSGSAGPDSEIALPSRIPCGRRGLARSLTERSIITEYNFSRSDDDELRTLAAEQGLKAMLAVPLKTEERSIGVFAVFKKALTPFLDSEIAAFMLLANHASMAVNVCLLNEELKSQNRELAANVNLTGGILASLSTGLMLLDNTGIVKLVNQAGAGLLLSSPGEMTGRRLKDVFPEAEVFLTAREGSYHEAELSRRDGTRMPVGFSIILYQGASGTKEGTIVTYQDLTEIKALEAAVLSKERFAAMGRVVAGVAHEIRNPLFGISSIGQIFGRELKDARHQELVNALLSETKRLNQLVEDLLIYGRPIKLSLSRCDLTSLWKEVIGFHRAELSEKKISVHNDFADMPLMAFLDANQIRQVFLNLIRNAIDATAADGQISIRLLLEDSHIIFKITDKGAGIPAESIDRVFDVFFTTKPKGTGLGLAICKKIVEDHGGAISIESRQWDWLEENRGTTVTVKLPYRGIIEAPGGI